MYTLQKLHILIKCFNLISLISANQKKCGSPDVPTLCCADYYSKNGNCVPCPPGYFGPNCSHACPYPTYGEKCTEGECECPKESCSTKYGCVKQSSMSPWLMSAIFKTTSSPIPSLQEDLKESTSYYAKKQYQDNFHEMDNETRSKIAAATKSDDIQYQGRYTATILISVAGTAISVLLIVTIVYQFKSKCLNHTENPLHLSVTSVYERGSEYSEVIRINN